MMKTDARPTPEQIQQMLEDQHDGGFTSAATIDEYVNALSEHGYVIVHPDDVPKPTPGIYGEYGEVDADGWWACFDSIFGARLPQRP